MKIAIIVNRGDIKKLFINNRKISKFDIPSDKLDEDFTREQMFEKFPSARTFPQITINGELVGGYTEFEAKVRSEE